jgi:hypothetical protein
VAGARIAALSPIFERMVSYRNGGCSFKFKLK